MAQVLASDFPIDPVVTSGTALADILNRQNDAVSTSNSGATAPAETSPGMLWLDTSVTPSVMRIRNSANTGWNTIPVSGGAGGSPFLLPDGTIAAPALAWASEPGLGWLRGAASVISMAAQGAQVSYINATNATSTFMGLLPRSAGATTLILSNQPTSTANYNFLSLAQNADGSARIATGVGGSAARGSLTIDAAGINSTSNINIAATAGNYAVLALTKLSSGLGSVVQGFNGSASRWAMNLGDNAAESGSNTGSNFSIGRYNDTGTFVDVPLVINRASGLTTLSTLTVAGRQLNTQGYGTQYGQAAGDSGDTFNFAYDGTGVRPYIGATWRPIANPSDERLKDNIEDLVLTDDEFLKVRPISFMWKADETRRTSTSAYGFSAQQTLADFPESGAVSGSEELMYGLNDQPLLAMTVERLQDLIRRVQQLETPAS